MAEQNMENWRLSRIEEELDRLEVRGLPAIPSDVSPLTLEIPDGFRDSQEDMTKTDDSFFSEVLSAIGGFSKADYSLTTTAPLNSASDTSSELQPATPDSPDGELSPQFTAYLQSVASPQYTAPQDRPANTAASRDSTSSLDLPSDIPSPHVTSATEIPIESLEMPNLPPPPAEPSVRPLCPPPLPPCPPTIPPCPPTVLSCPPPLPPCPPPVLNNGTSHMSRDKSPTYVTPIVHIGAKNMTPPPISAKPKLPRNISPRLHNDTSPYKAVSSTTETTIATPNVIKSTTSSFAPIVPKSVKPILPKDIKTIVPTNFTPIPPTNPTPAIPIRVTSITTPCITTIATEQDDQDIYSKAVIYPVEKLPDADAAVKRISDKYQSLDVVKPAVMFDIVDSDTGEEESPYSGIDELIDMSTSDLDDPDYEDADGDEEEHDNTPSPLLNETDVMQVEMFYRSHCTEVFVCRCTAQMSIGAAPKHSNMSLPPPESDKWTRVSTGVPVLILDSGDSRRDRKLSFVLAERGTGFLLWKDSINHLTGYQEVNVGFHTLHLSNDHTQLAAFHFSDEATSSDFLLELNKITSDPNDSLLSLTGKSKKKKDSKLKKKKYKAPNKTDISTPCCFTHVTNIDRAEGISIVGPKPAPKLIAPLRSHARMSTISMLPADGPT